MFFKKNIKYSTFYSSTFIFSTWRDFLGFQKLMVHTHVTCVWVWENHCPVVGHVQMSSQWQNDIIQGNTLKLVHFHFRFQLVLISYIVNHFFWWWLLLLLLLLNILSTRLSFSIFDVKFICKLSPLLSSIRTYTHAPMYMAESEQFSFWKYVCVCAWQGNEKRSKDFIQSHIVRIITMHNDDDEKLNSQYVWHFTILFLLIWQSFVPKSFSFFLWLVLYKLMDKRQEFKRIFIYL